MRVDASSGRIDQTIPSFQWFQLGSNLIMNILNLSVVSKATELAGRFDKRSLPHLKVSERVEIRVQTCRV
ncbi:hypothetical protein DGM85_05820 [Xanthomonas phaseoli pv. phaseoli]|nr:hypothetical protein ST27_24470 [Xanthomonas phaseoli pv. phaseoli]QWN28118.1 hypothetical protein DGM85_05820 [Xanthomonas phaseoli pv. phaseoli]